MEHKLKVAPTAALVLHFARPLFSSGLTHNYIGRTDLSEVAPMAAKLEELFKHFPETILFRKKYIRYLLQEYLTDDIPVQVCMLGAGLDPLTLHLLEEYPHAVSAIFEVDEEHIGIKKQLYPASEKIHFIQADITDTLHLPDRLRDAGYHPEIPAIIIFEGLIHYISDINFLNIMQFFRTPNKTNVVIMDYMLPENSLPASVLPVFRPLRQMMEAFIGGGIHFYNRAQVFSMVAALQGDVVSVASMQEVEYKLNGRNELYYGEGEGFIEMISCYI